MLIPQASLSRLHLSHASAEHEPLRLPPGFTSFVVLMAASKGGTGKSTLTTNLAVTAACAGLRALIIDSDIEDEQQTCMDWAEVRQRAAPKVIRAAITKVAKAIAWARQEGYQLVVIDTAGRDLVPMAAVVDQVDFMLTPSQPSPADLKATLPIRRLWQSNSTPASILLNGITRENAARTRAYQERYGKIGRVLPVAVVRRVQYVDAMDVGLGVSEYMPGGAGDIEMRNILLAMFGQAKVPKVTQ